MMRRAARQWASLGLCVSSLGVAASELPFDAETLRLRGIDPQLAQQLGQAAGFTAGQHSVALTVNGQDRGRLLAQFDAQGALQFDTVLLQAAGLVDGPQGFMVRFPLTQVVLEPQTASVRLEVPVAALSSVPADLSAFTTGGVAGLLNYDIQGLYNDFNGQSNQSWSVNTEAGFNAGDWIVRSRQLYFSANGRTRTEHLDAYAQRTFAAQEAVFQAGQINLANPVLAGPRIVGAQWMSEPALAGSTEMGRLEGIAASQARVEVHQGGALLYSTVVPAGPFALANVPGLDRRRDVQITVIEADGERRSFTVLAATLGLDLPATGFAFGVGQVREVAGVDSRPWVLSAGWSQPLWRRASLSSGALIADGYQSAGAGASLAPWTGSRVQAVLQGSQASRERTTGGQASLSLSQQWNPTWASTFTTARQSAGHRELSDTLWRRLPDSTDARARSQHAASVSWSHPTLGSLNGGYATSQLFDGRHSARAYASWGRQIGRASLSLMGEWAVAGEVGLGNALYFTASVPLGEGRRLRSSLRAAGGQHRVGVGLQAQHDETLGYRLAVERNGRDRHVDLNAGVSMQPRATQLDLGYASYGHGNAGYSAAVRGGMALHDSGLTLSPYPVQDTFAVLKVGEVPGVQVNTPAGPAWTDDAGQVLIAQVTPYGKSSVEVVASSLPRNVDLQQGAAVIQAGRGAVSRLAFGVVRTRRVLLQVPDVPAGAAVTDEQGGLVTLVQADGAVFVPNVHDNATLRVRRADGSDCQLHFDLPPQANADTYFERASAVCVPL